MSVAGVAYKGRQRFDEVRVLYDPTGCFTGNTFHRGDFMMTLKDGFWPPSMYIQQEDTEEVFIVRGNEFVSMDAPESEYRPQKLLLVRDGVRGVPYASVKKRERVYA